MHQHDSTTAAGLTGVQWQKSHYSNSQGACVELAGLPGDEIAVRNSRFPDGPVLLCTRAEIRSLLQGVKQGDFDHILH